MRIFYKELGKYILFMRRLRGLTGSETLPAPIAFLVWEINKYIAGPRRRNEYKNHRATLGGDPGFTHATHTHPHIHNRH